MGAVILLVSVVLVAVGTWKWVGLAKQKQPHTAWRKYLWGGMTLIGIVLFFLLKIIGSAA
ncbi:hypothetical protein LOK74_01125 [Brevibacillus humidisoli]|uniref:hypothetical protein n=1 Tax=Brevibacillus humidisoli TaxID=2895522 RepID=UPI001E4727C7|nr:hypothetical protein [Brevibacillus humidisoli]UFJ41191.1 hypothetical protein LOK74_01125 [Brevibacillus humidisoli]